MGLPDRKREERRISREMERIDLGFISPSIFMAIINYWILTI